MDRASALFSNGDGTGGGAMSLFKRTVLFTVILLACAGVYSAVRNMPVLSGCSFYSDCPDTEADDRSAVAAIDGSTQSGGT